MGIFHWKVLCLVAGIFAAPAAAYPMDSEPAGDEVGVKRAVHVVTAYTTVTAIETVIANPIPSDSLVDTSSATVLPDGLATAVLTDTKTPQISTKTVFREPEISSVPPAGDNIEPITSTATVYVTSPETTSTDGPEPMTSSKTVIQEPEETPQPVCPADKPSCESKGCSGKLVPGQGPLCTEGTQQGCLCIPTAVTRFAEGNFVLTCPVENMSCLDPACADEHLLLNRGTCTAKDTMLCPCTACSPVMCHDRTCGEAPGANGLPTCTFGARNGCPCTTCPQVMCHDNACGVAPSENDLFHCTLGDLNGCPCAIECPVALKCNQEKCMGTAADGESWGVCTDAPGMIFKGCKCTVEPSPEDELTCNVAQSARVHKFKAQERAEMEFCHEVVKQDGSRDKDSGAVTRDYVERELDRLRLAVDFPRGRKISYEECKAAFARIFLECDEGRGFSLGGSLLLASGDVKFRVEPRNCARDKKFYEEHPEGLVM